MIMYERDSSVSVSLRYSFQVAKEMEDKKSVVIAEFQLLKAAKGTYITYII